MRAPYVEHDWVDLFAGPRGAGLGITSLGFTEVGIEWDEAACETARAAGFDTICGDVSKVDPLIYWCVKGLWASPPCQGFTKAGLQKGLGDAGRLLAHIQHCEDEGDWVPFTDDEGWQDPRSHLVLEPLRWAIIARPRFLVLEQVPFVQIIWDAMKPTLEAFGYHVWTGKVSSEQYGVPQTRERALLLASLDGPVDRPAPTHSRYYPRSPEKLDPGVEKWVTMAQALGWTGTVGFPRRNDKNDGAEYRVRDFHDVEGRPAPVVTEKARSWTRLATDGHARKSDRSIPRDPFTQPAPTVRFGKAASAWQWSTNPSYEALLSRALNLSLERGPVHANELDDTPLDWVHDRPSPTVVGSFSPDVIAKAGYRKAGDPPRQKTPGSVRVTVQEAGVLQSFPVDYPWQGSRTKQFEQVGNAVPALLARHAAIEAARPTQGLEWAERMRNQ